MFASKRLFRLWEFRVSHSELLLRSPKGRGGDRNLDVKFEGVDYLEMPTKLNELEVSNGSAEDVLHAEKRLGRPVPPAQVFCIGSRGERFLIVAGYYRTQENDLDLFVSSLTPGQGVPPEGTL